MTQDLNLYPAYKDSGVPWLGQVPEHWGVRRLKTVARFAYGDSLPDESRQSGHVPVHGSNGQVGVHCAANTNAPCLVIGRKGSFGKVHYSSEPVFAIDTTYYVDRRLTSAHMRWLYYALTWCGLDKVSKDSAVPGLSREDAYEGRLTLPPPPEQAAIVRFLDHYDRLIRRYIRSKQRLIALLNEQKQAIIHRAVTRGLDPNVRLKPSGVEWLGDIPEHWEVVPNRSLMSPRKQIVGDRSGEFTLLSLTLRGIVPRDLDNPQGKFPSDFATYQVVEPADLVFCLFDMDETPRTVGMATVRGMVTGAYTVFHCFDSDTARFLHLFYESLDEDKRLRPFYTGLRKVVRTSTFLSIRVAIPPKNELSQILSLVALETTALETAIGRAQREIDLVREYRTRLIADVVTGKLDVREASANLPEEAEETEELEEAEGADGEFEEAESEAETAEVLA